LPIEDIGIAPDYIIRPTKRDYTTGELDFLSGAVAVVLSEKAVPSSFGKAIYWGKDTREDLYKVKDNAMVYDNSLCVGGIFEASSIEESNNNTYTLSAGILGKSFRLQKGEIFWDQPSFDPDTNNGANGTVFLVLINNKEYIITAGHCVRDPYSGQLLSPVEISSKRIVFGFKLDNPTDNPLLNVDPGRIYQISSILTSKLDGTGDWAVCMLDRPVNRNFVKPCEKLELGDMKINDPLYVMGHPSGLPLKHATGIIRDIAPISYFRTDLTTFAGNSGSPVFNKNTHKIVGILVRGATDYQETMAGTCKTAVITYWASDVGEDVSRISFPLKEAHLI